MLITTALCTRNRAASLDRLLRSLREMTVPPGLDWEVLVVDNGSTDDTAAVVRAWMDQLPLRRVEEPVPGLSHARNRAAVAAGGEYIVWTDDDAVVDPGWLAAWAEAFAAFPADAFFGGPIAVRFEGTPPSWLPRVLARVPGAFGMRQLGDRMAPLGPGLDRLPFGGNYAVRTAAQRRHPYDPALGARPGAFVWGEEMAMFLSMLAAGETGRWVPGARVTHCVAPDRQNERYIRRFYRYDAATRTGSVEEHRLRLLARALRAEARYRVLRASAPAERWIRALVHAADAWGGYDRTTTRRD